MRIPDVTAPFMSVGRAALMVICLLVFSSTTIAADMPDFPSPEDRVRPAGSTQPLAQTSLLERLMVREQYLAVFTGDAQLADARITTTSQCLLCALTSGSQDFRFAQSRQSGIRSELWGKHFGMAFELGSASNAASMPEQNGASASIGYNSVTIMPMLRLPLLATDTMPDGRLNLYGGLGLDFIAWMSMNISVPGQPPLSAHLSGRSNTASLGTVFLAGISWHYSRWVFFAEHRTLDTRMDYDGSINNFSLDPVRTANVPIHMTQMIAGIKYRF